MKSCNFWGFFYKSVQDFFILLILWNDAKLASNCTYFWDASNGDKKKYFKWASIETIVLKTFGVSYNFTTTWCLSWKFYSVNFSIRIIPWLILFPKIRNLSNSILVCSWSYRLIWVSLMLLSREKSCWLGIPSKREATLQKKVWVTQCGNFRIFLPSRFYVKSIFGISDKSSKNCHFNIFEVLRL